jgi:hypothetical protein
MIELSMLCFGFTIGAMSGASLAVWLTRQVILNITGQGEAKNQYEARK